MLVHSSRHDASALSPQAALSPSSSKTTPQANFLRYFVSPLNFINSIIHNVLYYAHLFRLIRPHFSLYLNTKQYIKPL